MCCSVAISLPSSGQFRRRIGFVFQARSVEFGRELRLNAACRMLELGFSSGHVSQHCLEPLRTQYQEAKQQNEQNLRAKAHCLTPWSSDHLWWLTVRSAFLPQLSSQT